MDDRQDRRRVSLLFTNWWQDTNLAIANLKNGLIRISVLVSHHNPMQPPDSLIAHFFSNRMVSVSGEAINAGSHQKIHTNLLRDAEQFIDVALSIADIHTSLRLTEVQWIAANARAIGYFLFSQSAPALD